MIEQNEENLPYYRTKVYFIVLSLLLFIIVRPQSIFSVISFKKNRFPCAKVDAKVNFSSVKIQCSHIA